MQAILDRNRLKPLQLTTRQKQCVDLLSVGYSPKQIAELLNVSRRTVNYHLLCLQQRFDSRSLPHLIYQLAQLDYFK